MVLADTHTHLYAEEFGSERKALIETAIQKGINYFFLPNIDRSSITGMLELEKQFPKNCFAMMGLHPCSVKSDYQAELQIVEEWLTKRKFWAIGEIGIDLYWDKTFLKEQQEALSRQLQLAKKYNLPFVIHTRESFNEVIEIVKTFKQDQLSGIFHCFTGTIEQAQEVIAAGNYKLGIGGVVTFKKSGLDEVVKAIDLQHLVLETDAPYLAPTPFRGKRNDPELPTR
jgi:TatD DNase family protein